MFLSDSAPNPEDNEAEVSASLTWGELSMEPLPKVSEKEIAEAMHVALMEARKYMPNRAEEIASDCALYIVRAIDTFDRSRGVPFAGYCRSWIRRQITRSIAMVSLPLNISHEVTDYPEKMKAFTRISLDVSDQHTPSLLEDEETFHKEFSVEPQTDYAFENENLQRALEILTPFERNLIESCFFNDSSPEKLSVLLGYERTYARKHLNKALLRMRAFLDSKFVPLPMLKLPPKIRLPKTIEEKDLARLRSVIARTVRLYVFEKKSIKEIAAIEKKTTTSIRWRLRQATKKLCSQKHS